MTALLGRPDHEGAIIGFGNVTTADLGAALDIVGLIVADDQSSSSSSSAR